MEPVIATVVAALPAAALLLVPRSLFKPVATLAALAVLCGILWTWSFGNSCSSDGCIGVFIIGALTALMAASAGVAGLIRWLIIRARTGSGGKAG